MLLNGITMMGIKAKLRTAGLFLKNVWMKEQPSHAEHELVHRRVEEVVSDLACESTLSDENDKITYVKLNSNANKLARLLIHEIQSTPGLLENRKSIITIILDHGQDLVMSILAVLKMNMAYLPIDPTAPLEKVCQKIDECRPLCVVMGQSVGVSAKVREFLVRRCIAFDIGKLKELMEDYDEDNISTSEQIVEDNHQRGLAVVLYTSGHRHRPQGVRITHKNIINQVEHHLQSFPMIDKEKLCIKMSPIFVESIVEIFLPLMSGVDSVIAPRSHLSSAIDSIEFLDANKITRLHTTPYFFKSMIDVLKRRDTGKTCLDSLHLWLVSGEMMHSSSLTQFFDIFPSNKEVCNAYSMSETTGDFLFSVYRSKKDVMKCTTMAKLPFTTLLENSSLYLQDKEGNVLLGNGRGEAFVGGSCVADGYMLRTLQDSFVTTNQEGKKFNDGCHIFQTGDIMKRLDGLYFFEGRVKDEIKMLGKNVNLHDIEELALSVDNALKAAAILIETEENTESIVLFIESESPSEETVPAVEERLKCFLESANVPCKIVLSRKIPILENGKVDHRYLKAWYRKTFVNGIRQTNVQTSPSIGNMSEA